MAYRYLLGRGAPALRQVKSALSASLSGRVTGWGKSQGGYALPRNKVTHHTPPHYMQATHLEPEWGFFTDRNTAVLISRLFTEGPLKILHNNTRKFFSKFFFFSLDVCFEITNKNYAPLSPKRKKDAPVTFPLEASGRGWLFYAGHGGPESPWWTGCRIRLPPAGALRAAITSNISNIWRTLSTLIALTIGRLIMTWDPHFSRKTDTQFHGWSK